MTIILYLLKHSPLRLLLAAVLCVLAGLSGAALIALIGHAVSAPQLGTGQARLFVALSILMFVLRSLCTITLTRQGQQAVSRFRTETSHKLLAARYSTLQQLGKSELLVILTSDITSFANAFQIMAVTTGNAFLVVVCLAYLAWLSIPLFLIIVGIGLIGFLAYAVAERGPAQGIRQLRMQLSVLHRSYRDLIEGSRELKINRHRGNQFLEGHITPAARQLRRTFITAMTQHSIATNSGTMMFYVAIGFVLFGAPLWLSVDHVLAIKVTFVISYLIGPVSQMMNALPTLHEGGVSLKRIQQLEQAFRCNAEPTKTNNPFACPSLLKLELRGIEYEYIGTAGDRGFLLGPLNVSLNKGELIFIVGGNGSGKTTLTMVLLGFYECSAGNIVLNGVSVDDSNVDHYRQLFSVVFYDFHLFDFIVGSEESTQRRAQFYLEKLGLAHKVQIRDGRFTTTDLSSGQRKRLALILAYLDDRPIYLFDEWAADQDPEFKKVFYKELLPDLKARGKLVIVITHDDAYYDCADRIMILNDGILTERANRTGTHQPNNLTECSGWAPAFRNPTNDIRSSTHQND